jgi:hypothetical protein
MKRIISLVAILVITATLFAGCANGAPSPSPVAPNDAAAHTPEATPTAGQGAELELNIELATEERLGSFAARYDVDYTRVREARDGGDFEPLNGDTLVIWANVPLYQLAVLSVGNDFINDEFWYIPIQEFDTIHTLHPGQALVIRSYVSVGMLPWSGITFTDGNGARHYFTIFQDQSDEFPPYRLLPFENRSDELPADWVPWWE